MSTPHPLDPSLSPPTHPITTVPRFSSPAPDPAQPLPHLTNGRPHPSLFGMDDAVPDTSETLVDSGQIAKPAVFDRFESPAGSFPTIRNEGWEEAFERQQKERYREKVEQDLRGWRGGNGEPRSGYSQEAVPTNSYYGQPVTGVIGRHLPKEIVRIDRDWSDGEVCQFQSTYPMELEGRITPAQWTGFIEGINDRMMAAYSVTGAVVDNLIAIASWWTSLFWRTSHFEKNLHAAENDIAKANQDLFNPAGLNVLSPRHNALQFMEIEYY